MNIFLADDHPITVEGYYNALSSGTFASVKTNFTKAYNCEDAYTSLTQIISAKKKN